MVRLGVDLKYKEYIDGLRFNSSMVRLGAMEGMNMSISSTSFNSSMVRLGDNYLIYLFMNLPSFNSSMVRLGERVTGTQYYAFWFQFQYGAIGSVSHFHVAYLSRQVSIPVWCDWECSIFNSLKSISQFQFQYGAIGSYQPG